MNKLQKIGFASLSIIVWIQQSFAIDFGWANVDTKIKWSENTADQTIQNLISNAMLFIW
jgi:hypothetical protein